MRRFLAAFALWLARVMGPSEVLQLHLISQDGEEFQIAQKTFPSRTASSLKLAWFSEMVRRSSIENPRPELYSPGQMGFLRLHRGDFGPTYLTSGEALK